MTQEKTLRQRINDGEVLVALRGSIKTSKNELADIWSTGVYDYIWIDGQHTAYTEQQLVDYCGAAEELGIDVQLRIPHTRHAYLVGRFLDFGFSAVLVPEVMEPETVDDAIAYAYYGPIGRRSWGGTARRGGTAHRPALGRPRPAQQRRPRRAARARHHAHARRRSCFLRRKVCHTFCPDLPEMSGLRCQA